MPSNEAFEVFFQKIIQERPKTSLQDIYKLLYQAEFGPGHAIPSQEVAKERLQAEIKQLTSEEINRSGESILEELSPGSSYVRINLRPYIKNKCSEERLVEEFFHASFKKAGSESRFREVISILERAITTGKIKLGAKGEEDTYIFEMAQKLTIPQVSHSKAYKNSYSPSYRVVLKEDGEKLCKL